MRYDEIASGYIELTPGNGHVFIYKGDKVDLSTARIVPATGETVEGFFSIAADSDTPITGTHADLNEIGNYNGKTVYIAALDGSIMTTALPENDFPDGTEVFEIMKAGTRARQVARMTVRRYRES